MRMSHFFIERPIFAAVLSILLTIAGAIAQRSLPVAEYPDIAPPTVNVSTYYPGASAEVIAETVATPLEQKINGVDDMLYMTSQSTGDGKLSIDVVFKPGTDVDKAQVLVQNRVAIATPRLPQEVIRQGVTVEKASPDLMMVIHMISPDESRDHNYISNYATLYVKDRLSRVDGVGNVSDSRRPGLLDARLARSGKGGGPRPYGRRGRLRPAGCEPPGGRRRHQSTPSGTPGRLPAVGSDARAPEGS